MESDVGLSPWRRVLAMAALIGAGEAIFFLPFVLARVFRPTLLDVFGLTNFELGTAFSLYGLVAMGAYFGGGFLADRFPANRLLAFALLATALGGVVLAGVPGLGTLRLLFAYWGLTTIFLFWAALIRATRVWGGATAQGRAYGLLDGGRGLFAALMASAGVAIFAQMLPADVATATLEQRSAALVRAIWAFTGMTVAAGLLVWFAIPRERREAEPSKRAEVSFGRDVLAMPTVWLQALIVLCAYVGYKSSDDFGLYVRDAFSYDDVAAAKVSTIALWIRPFAALTAGLIADRLRPSTVLRLGFTVLTVGSLAIASGLLTPDLSWAIVATIVTAAVGMHALRGVYHATLAEARVPLAVTGSAVGVISFVGYTPDVFFGPLSGWLLDRSPGAAGHQHLFTMVAGFAAVGFVASLLLSRLARRAPS